MRHVTLVLVLALLVGMVLPMTALADVGVVPFDLSDMDFGGWSWGGYTLPNVGYDWGSVPFHKGMPDLGDFDLDSFGLNGFKGMSGLKGFSMGDMGDLGNLMGSYSTMSMCDFAPTIDEDDDQVCVCLVVPPGMSASEFKKLLEKVIEGYPDNMDMDALSMQGIYGSKFNGVMGDMAKDFPDLMKGMDFGTMGIDGLECLHLDEFRDLMERIAVEHPEEKPKVEVKDGRVCICVELPEEEKDDADKEAVDLGALNLDEIQEIIKEAEVSCSRLPKLEGLCGGKFGQESVSDLVGFFFGERVG